MPCTWEAHSHRPSISCIYNKDSLITANLMRQCCRGRGHKRVASPTLLLQGRCSLAVTPCPWRFQAQMSRHGGVCYRSIARTGTAPAQWSSLILIFGVNFSICEFLVSWYFILDYSHKMDFYLSLLDGLFVKFASDTCADGWMTCINCVKFTIMHPGEQYTSLWGRCSVTCEKVYFFDRKLFIEWACSEQCQFMWFWIPTWLCMIWISSLQILFLSMLVCLCNCWAVRIVL
jgi:hypothetical protein